MKKVILSNDREFCADYSVEAGKSDGKKHFDHHGDFSGHVAPCKINMPMADDNSIIQISHVDADTFVGLLKLFGRSLPNVDFDLMEKIDLNGSSVCRDKFNTTLLYMVGVGEIARGLKFPRTSDNLQEVTSLIQNLMMFSHSEVIAIGRKATELSEATYRNCWVARDGKIGFWAWFSIDMTLLTEFRKK